MPPLSVSGLHGGSGKRRNSSGRKNWGCLFTPATKDLDFKATLEGCPYNIPRQDPKTKALFKCTMCFDRLSNNQIPACVKSCPTGAMVFGERDKIVDMAKKSVQELKKDFPQAQALNVDDVRVIYRCERGSEEILPVRSGQIARTASHGRWPFSPN